MIHTARGVFISRLMREEEHSEFSYDQSELYLSICNEDLEKQCSEESDGVQLVEVFSQPSSSHIDFPYV